MRDTTRRADPADGVSLCLLVIITLLLCGSTWSVWRLYLEVGHEASVPLPGALEEGPPGSGTEPSRYGGLYLNDLALGLLYLEEHGSPTTRLSDRQWQALARLEPRVRPLLEARQLGPTELDSVIMKELTVEQQEELWRVCLADRVVDRSKTDQDLARFLQLLQRDAPPVGTDSRTPPPEAPDAPPEDP